LLVHITILCMNKKYIDLSDQEIVTQKQRINIILLE